MTHPSSHAALTIPADDPERDFTVARSDDPNLPQVCSREGLVIAATVLTLHFPRI